MRLSLWQQFSSNHSASFTVVGEFDSPVEAESAESYLRALFENIWETSIAQDLYSEDSPSWAEVVASGDYGIQWDNHIDWVTEQIDEHVVRFRNLIFVSNGLAGTWQCSETIEALVRKMTTHACVQRNCLEYTLIVVELECLAPNKAVVAKIAGEVSRYLRSEKLETSIPPWEAERLQVRIDDYSLLFPPADGAQNPEFIMHILRVLFNYQDSIVTRHNVVQAEQDALEALLQLKDAGFHFQTVINIETLPQLVEQVGLYTHCKILGGHLKTSGLKIYIPEIAFMGVEYSLPAFINYLERNGCTELLYTLKTVPEMFGPKLYGKYL